MYIDLTNKISVDLEELTANSNSFLEIVKYTQPWFADLNPNITYNDDFIEYALTDFGYRNTTKVLYFMYSKKYIPDLKLYKTNGLEIIALIDKKLEDE
ncbi:hypothetical protein [Psychroserpens luteus]|uniref:Uncharacterized protein n=1 Tax=Psychroserpens luteus TaxID=1434066 RepID=A0ABW5ZV64_9FLAO|nr:hypothetical protein [Psychroserpens luteus]